jgi:glycine/D-amino acid oxidase-like deaminating enzyme
MRTHPYFLDTFPASRRPSYPRFRGAAATSVVIVGGGLTGAACAAAFATSGVKTILLEADRVGAAATAGNPGLLRHDFDASFQDTVARYGLRDARHLWEGARRASLDFASALRRLNIRCALEPQPLIELTREGPERARRLRREYDARRQAGLDVSWMTSAALQREAKIAGDGALKVKGDAIDPYRACLGLMAAAASRGAGVFEQSAVTRIRARKKAVEVRTARGTITADAVLVATGGPLGDLRALRRHLPLQRSFFVVTEPLPAAIRREVGPRASGIVELRDSPRLLRWLPEDRVLFSSSSDEPPARRPGKNVVTAEAMELMYQLTTLYPAISGVQPAEAWDTDGHGSPDGLPVIGRHRNFPRHLFALGAGRNGVGVAWLAARVLLRSYLEEPAKRDEVFGFSRLLA